jgi:hypothetical protein
MSRAIWMQGDVYEQVALLKPGSVDLAACSPPFWLQRSYLTPDDPLKAFELGQEPTPAAFIGNLLRLVAALDPVLAPHGSLVFELGDTMAGSGGAGGDYNPGGLRDGQQRTAGSAKFRAGYLRNDRPSRVPQDDPKAAEPPQRPTRSQAARTADESRRGVDARNRGNTSQGTVRAGRENPGALPPDKSVCFIPQLFGAALAYGHNLLDPDSEPFEPWRVRQFITWGRPNPSPGELHDSFRRGCSYIIVACRSRRRWFDLHAVRTPASPNTNARTAKGVEFRPNDGKVSPDSNRGSLAIQHSTTTAPPLDWWDDTYEDDELPDLLIQTTEQYRGSHYATWPRKLAARLIDSMCPHAVCTTCGEPRRRLILSTRINPPDDRQRVKFANGERPAPGRQERPPEIGWEYDRQTLGWSECGCGDGCRPTTWETRSAPVLDDAGAPILTAKGTPKMRKQRVVADVGECNDDTHWRRGVVLDPFAGSGTTLAVATGKGRDAIGIDLDPKNLNLARERIGIFLEEPA